MASSARNVRYIYLKMMHCKRLYHHPEQLCRRNDQTHRTIHSATKNFVAESEKEEADVEHDLDFYGVQNLTDKSYEPEPLDPVKAEKFQNVKLSQFTGEQKSKFKPTIEFEQKLPFGSIRYDKQPTKRLSYIESNLISEEKEKDQIVRRKMEKEAKKKEKKVRNMHDRSQDAKLVSYAQNQNSTHMPVPAEKHSSKNNDYTKSVPNISYMDEMCFGSADVERLEQENVDLEQEANSDELYSSLSNQQSRHTEESINPSGTVNEETDLSYIDKQYFDPELVDVPSSNNVLSNVNGRLTKYKNDQEEENELIYIDKQYFEQDNSREDHVTEHVVSLTEEVIKQSTENIEETDLSYIDKQYMDPELVNVHTSEAVSSQMNGRLIDNTSDQHEENHLSYIDNQYFEHGYSQMDGKAVLSTTKETIKQPTSQSEETDLSYIDKQYFENEAVNVQSSEQNTKGINIKKTLKESKVLQRHAKQEPETWSTSHVASDFSDESQTRNMYARQNSSNKDLHAKEIKDDFAVTKSLADGKHNLHMKGKEEFQMRSDLDAIQHFQNQRTHLELGNRKNKQRKAPITNETEDNAYSVARKLRDEYERKEKLDVYGRANPKEYDSKGFRILTGQTPDFTHVPSIDIIKILRQNILYDSFDVVAISKPYGLPLQGGFSKDKSIDQFLGDIIPFTTLHSIDTLDTETTGVMLFGKTEEMKTTLKEKLKQGEICKRFLTITKNVPKIPQGEIDIPLVDCTVEGKHRMALRPHRTAELASVMPRQRQGKEAITRYRVLDSKENSYALLECIPITSNKHQIRAHLSLGLNCPILGDHKYSHMNKLAPMNLHPIMLKRLKIQQSKVRHLALHLHCRSIVIPNFLQERNLFVSAPLSVHFKANMRDLKLKLPSHC